MFKLFLILASILLCSPLIRSQTNITDCSSLQAIIINNNTVSYVLTGDIDCANFSFTPLGSPGLPFRGILDGKGFKIKNLNMEVSNDNIGIFSAAADAIFQNITLQDVNITATADIQNVGVLLGSGDNVTITDVHLVTSIRSQNIIQATTLCQYVGSIAGIINSGTVTRVSATNTTVSIPGGSWIAGVLNSGGDPTSTNTNTSFVFNYGYPTNSSEIIVQGNFGVGGVCGAIKGGRVFNSGTVRGKVVGSTNYVGGFAGANIAGDVDSVFSRPDVSVSGVGHCGGLFGIIQTQGTARGVIQVTNAYSRASSVVSDVFSAGLAGFLNFFDVNNNISISNCYAASNVSGSDITALFGPVDLPERFFTSNLFYDNKFANDTYGTGLNCSALFATVSSNFSSAIWGNDRLLIEPNYAPGVCSCSVGCPTVAPSVTPTVAPSVTPTVAPSVTPTVAPSVTPTTSPTITPINFSGVYNVAGSCQNSQTCCCPTGKVSVTQQSNNVTVSISAVTGNCTKTGAQAVTFTLTTSTSGTGVFNGVSYTVNYANQKITFTSSTACTTTVTCESGNCRSLPSTATVLSFSFYVLLMISLISLVFF